MATSPREVSRTMASARASKLCYRARPWMWRMPFGSRSAGRGHPWSMSISEFSRRQVPRAAPLTLVLCLQSAPLSAYVSDTPARPDAPADERPEVARARRYGAPRPPDEPLPPYVGRERRDYRDPP